MAVGEIWHGMFPFYPGIFFELSPIQTPITTLAARNGFRTTHNKLYTQTYHTNATQTSANLKGDKGTVDYGSTGFTTGSNTVNILFEGAYESWARRGDQQLGRTQGWQMQTNPSFEPSALGRARAEALDRMKRMLEFQARQGTFRIGGGGGEGTSGTDAAWSQRGIRNDPQLTVGTANGAVTGSGTLGTYGTLTFSKIMDTLESLWLKRQWNGESLLAISNSTAKRQITDIFVSNFNFGKNGISRTESGVSLTRFDTDFGPVDLAMSYDMPASDLYFLNVSKLQMVGRPVPGKGIMFEDPIISNGVAGDGVGIYAELGMDYGIGQNHAMIKGIGSVIIGGVAWN